MRILMTFRGPVRLTVIGMTAQTAHCNIATPASEGTAIILVARVVMSDNGSIWFHMTKHTQIAKTIAIIVLSIRNVLLERDIVRRIYRSCMVSVRHLPTLSWVP